MVAIALLVLCIRGSNNIKSPDIAVPKASGKRFNILPIIMLSEMLDSLNTTWVTQNSYLENDQQLLLLLW